jgi:hypothetical protein
MGDESAWLGDFLVGVFSSPTWEGPLMDFIDLNCAAFDVGEESALRCTRIHDEFCAIVDAQLDLHLAEIGLSAEDFMSVVMAAGPNTELRRVVTEQVLAVDDFITFKKLMARRNAELNLEVLQSHAGMREQAQQREDGGADADLAAALAASREDMLAIEEAQAALETAQMEAALAASLALEEQRAAMVREAKVRVSQEAEAAVQRPESVPAAASPAKGSGAAPRQSASTSSGSSLADLPSLRDARAPPKVEAVPATRQVGAAFLPPIVEMSGSFLPPLSPSAGQGGYSRGVDGDDLDALLAEGGSAGQKRGSGDAPRRKAGGGGQLEVLGEAPAGAGAREDPEERKRHLQELRLALRAQKTAERAAALSAVTGGGATSGVPPLPTAQGGGAAAQDEATRRAHLAAKIRSEVMEKQ